MSFRLVLITGIAAAQLVAAPAFGQENFGHFPDEPTGTWVTVPGGRPLFKLSEDFRYFDPEGLEWRALAGRPVDGATIPPIFWSVVGGPFSGAYLHASIIHDHYCDTQERTSDATHLAFYYGMRAKGVARWKASAMYWAVIAFGPKWREAERIVLVEVCEPGTISISCAITPTRETVTVMAAGLDAGDPEALAIAEAKFAAIVRTLKTSDGEVLDVGPSGNIGASPDSIRQNALNFAHLVETKAYLDRPELLGILSATGLEEFDDTVVWPGGALPEFDQLSSFGGATELQPFMLAPGDLQGLQDQLLFEQRTFEFELPTDLR